MTDLKSCPFCGGKAEVRAFTLTMQFVQCMECRARTAAFETSEEAQQSWNKRNTLADKLRRVLKSWLKNWLKD